MSERIDPDVKALMVVICRTLAYLIKWLKKRYEIAE